MERVANSPIGAVKGSTLREALGGPIPLSYVSFHEGNSYITLSTVKGNTLWEAVGSPIS